MSVAERLQELDLILPTPPKPIAAYVPCVQTGQLVVISGQLPITGQELLARGPVPSAAPVDQAQSAAQQCVLNGLAILNEHLEGDLDRVTRVVRIGVFVQSDSGFHDQAIVANGASELLQRIFGEKGKHARAAVGVNALPLNASVEIEFLYEVA
ncbi:RidA family protein [Thalassoglobus sp.]|uniref:RidA family protein n=1 Tax=Thalassoglobus sp. TaxID=2795869 RepID=UPI003AA97655